MWWTDNKTDSTMWYTCTLCIMVVYSDTVSSVEPVFIVTYLRRVEPLFCFAFWHGRRFLGFLFCFLFPLCLKEIVTGHCCFVVAQISILAWSVEVTRARGYVCVRARARVFVCVWDWERETETERQTDRQTDRQREREFLSYSCEWYLQKPWSDLYMYLELTFALVKDIVRLDLTVNWLNLSNFLFEVFYRSRCVVTAICIDGVCTLFQSLSTLGGGHDLGRTTLVGSVMQLGI